MKHYSKFVIETIEEMKKEVLVNYSYNEIRQIVEGIAADEETAKAFLDTNFNENLEKVGVGPFVESEVAVEINDFEKILFRAMRFCFNEKEEEKTYYYVKLKSSITDKEHEIVKIEVPSKRYGKRMKRNAQMCALCKYILGDIKSAVEF